MIISASRRTDIPAFYGPWLMNRLRQGCVLVRNPMNVHQVSRVPLRPADVECLVFWTKNPAPMLTSLQEIDDLGYHYYFLFTLTPYDSTVELHVPPRTERIATFRALAARIGMEKVIWRYDPILLTDRFPPAFHAAAFTEIAGQLAGSTEKCIVSFVEMYRKCQRNMKELKPLTPTDEDRLQLLRTLQQSCTAHGITLTTCATGSSLPEAGIPASRCIDGQLVQRLSARPIHGVKDKNQRAACNCTGSIDIGSYDSCPHGCLYCYANEDLARARRNHSGHSPDSALLYGVIDGRDTITDRTMRPPGRQQRLF